MVQHMHPDDMKQGPFGYGMLWWIWDGPFSKDAYAGAYTGRGAVGQYITVLPALDMVIAHKTNQNRERREVTWKEYSDVLDKVISAKCGR